MKQLSRIFGISLLVALFMISMPVNAQYNAVNDNVTTIMNTPIVIHVRANDSYPFSYQTKKFFVAGVTSGNPSNGTIEYIGDDVLYTPNPGYTGLDIFLYAISLNGTSFVDSALVHITVVADSDPAFHLNMVGIPPASCTGGSLKVFMKNGTAPYVYQINGSAVSTSLIDSIIVPNFISHTGTIQVTDANNNTINTSFTIPINHRILCLDGPMSSNTPPNECMGNVSFRVWSGTPPFTSMAQGMGGPVNFLWENNDSHSRLAYAANVCQGIYNLTVTDSNGVQANGSFMVDTNNTNFPPITSGIDTCIAITGYTSAFVSDVYTNSMGTYAVWNIVLAGGNTVVLNVLYPISNAGTYQFILYVNCPGGKSTVMLTSVFNVLPSDLVASIFENDNFSNVNVFPNPLKDRATINFYSKRQTQVEITIFNIIGEIIASYSTNASTGLNEFVIDSNNLAQGTYLVQLVDDRLNKMVVKVVR